MIRSYNLPIIGDRSGFQEIDAELEKGIIGDDTRERVIDCKASPYRFICHLLIEQTGSDGSARTVTGTGTLIGNNHVVTCGHSLIERVGATIYTAQRVAVTPGKDTSRNADIKDRLSWTPFGSHIAQAFASAAPWRNNFNRQYDFGLITLKTEVGKKTLRFLGNRRLGYWGSAAHGEGTLLQAVDPATIRNREVIVCGYPFDKCGANPYDGVTCSKGQRGGTQFQARGIVSDPAPAAESRLLYHQADTKEGQSGGPIWRSDGPRRYLVGVESSSETTYGQYTLNNIGVRITDEVLIELRRLGWRV